MTPYAYKTTDYGQTWTSLNLAESGVQGYAHVIKEDTVDPISCSSSARNSGCGSRSTAASTGRSTRAATFPTVAVRDIVVHPRTSDLVLATHGRGIWIIDDISPLRALTPDFMTKNAVVMRRHGDPVLQRQWRLAGGRRRPSSGRAVRTMR